MSEHILQENAELERENKSLKNKIESLVKDINLEGKNMKTIEISDEIFHRLFAIKQFIYMERIRDSKGFTEFPTFDDVFNHLENGMEYVNTQNAKLINQLLLAEIKPYYMDQKHFDETKPLRDESRRQLEEETQ